MKLYSKNPEDVKNREYREKRLELEHQSRLLHARRVKELESHFAKENLKKSIYKLNDLEGEDLLKSRKQLDDKYLRGK